MHHDRFQVPNPSHDALVGELEAQQLVSEEWRRGEKRGRFHGTGCIASAGTENSNEMGKEDLLQGSLKQSMSN